MNGNSPIDSTERPYIDINYILHYSFRLGEVSQENLNSGLGEAESDRQGRFAMYWMTTTFTSTTTSYTATTTIGKKN